MELLKAFGYLLVLVIVIGGAALALRWMRFKELDKQEMTPDELEATRSSLLAYVQKRTHSLGVWVALPPVWRNVHATEGDRHQILEPLLREEVFLVRDTTENSPTATTWNPGWLMNLPTEVCLSEREWITMSRGEPVHVGDLIIMGDWVNGAQDNSVTHGDRAGRDITHGDNVGHDKLGPAAHGLSAGGDVSGSANEGSSWEDFTISTSTELESALTQLADQADARAENSQGADSLRWAAAMLTSRTAPSARDQAIHQRTLDRSNGWLRDSLTAIIQSVSGTLANHWVVEFLRG